MQTPMQTSYLSSARGGWPVNLVSLEPVPGKRARFPAVPPASAASVLARCTHAQRKILARSRVARHHFHVPGVVQGEREQQAVNPGRFTNPRRARVLVASE
jgi:hypothetical protein